MSYSTAINNIIITAELTLAAKDGSGDLTLKICSSNIETFETTTFSEHIPILKNISALTQEHDQFLPVTTAAQITIDNSEGSLAFQRRFIDLLETHTITEQDCDITINLKTDVGTTATYSETLSYKMQECEASFDSSDAIIALKNNPISESVISKEITVADFPSAYTSSIGRFLPVVFGSDATVLCEKLGGAEYGYATNFGSDYKCSAPSQYFVKSLDGEYREIEFAATTSTVLLKNVVTTASSVEIFGDEELGNRQGHGWELQDFTNNETGYIIDRGTFTMIGQTGLSIVGLGNWIFEIAVGTFPTVGQTQNIPQYKILGSATVSKSDYETEMNLAAEYQVPFTFDDPVIISKDQNESLTYFLLATDTDSRNTSFSYYYDHNLSSGTVKKLRMSERYGGWEYTSDSSTSAEFNFYGATVTDTSSTTTDDKGLAYHSFTIDTGTSSNNLDKYNFGVVVDGLGTTSSPDTTAPVIIKNLLAQTNNAYVDADFDDYWTASQTAYPREISGALVGKVSLTSALRELCRNGACRIFNVAGFSANKGVDIWSWGTELTSLLDLYDTDIKLNSIRIAGRELVINNITASYDKNPIKADAEEFLRQGIVTGYTKNISNRSISANSISLYGRNDLTDSSFQLIKTAESMQSVADYFLRSFDNPPQYVDLTLPYLPIKLIPGRAITILSPKTPAYYGTATTPLPAIYNGAEVIIEDASEQVRAKRYRAFIEGKRTEMDSDGKTKINLRCKLLIGAYDPT